MRHGSRRGAPNAAARPRAIHQVRGAEVADETAGAHRARARQVAVRHPLSVVPPAVEGCGVPSGASGHPWCLNHPLRLSRNSPTTKPGWSSCGVSGVPQPSIRNLLPCVIQAAILVFDGGNCVSSAWRPCQFASRLNMHESKPSRHVRGRLTVAGLFGLLIAGGCGEIGPEDPVGVGFRNAAILLFDPCQHAPRFSNCEVVDGQVALGG